MRITRKILELERQSAALVAQDYLMYFAIEELRNKGSDLLIQGVAILACIAAVTVNPSLNLEPVEVLWALGFGMAVCTLITAKSRHCVLGAIARIVFVLCCAALFCLLTQASPNALFWHISICAVILVAMSPLHHDPFSHLTTAVLVCSGLFWAHYEDIYHHTEHGWILCVVTSSAIFGALMNGQLFLARTRIYKANRLLFEFAYKDSLTGINNRRAFMSELSQMQANGQLGDASLLLIDADDFKAINDRHGHDVGDEVLKVIGAVVQGTRGVALCGRIGGEEFAAITRGTVLQARVIADTLNRRIAEPRDMAVQTTISVGIAPFGSGISIEETLRRADRALYEAKRLGKNRHHVFSASTPLQGGGAA